MNQDKMWSGCAGSSRLLKEGALVEVWMKGDEWGLSDRRFRSKQSYFSWLGHWEIITLLVRIWILSVWTEAQPHCPCSRIRGWQNQEAVGLSIAQCPSLKLPTVGSVSFWVPFEIPELSTCFFSGLAQQCACIKLMGIIAGWGQL